MSSSGKLDNDMTFLTCLNKSTQENW